MSHTAEPIVEMYTEDDRLEIQRAYRRLLKSIKTPLSEEDKHDIRRAYEIAVEAHGPQRRKSGEAYILHPIEVARICAEEIGLGGTAIVAALLHDVVEDTTIKLSYIKEEFGVSSIIITHDLVCAKTTGDRLVMMFDGVVQKEGTFEEVFDSDDERIKSFYDYNFT